ncbi:MAG: GNAT family N-acetyltransferase [Alloprevotella sp.]|nr:GNAT family N-acetyltransferase [Alloprevotella sp.]
MIRIPYSATHCEQWNLALRVSCFPSLLLERAYMDYHADRFEDASLMFVDHKGRTEGLVASSIQRPTRTILSHGGLTYGGLVPSCHATYAEVDEMLSLAAQYYRDELGMQRWVYKVVPQPYWSKPADEVLYWLTQHGGQLTSRGLSSALPLDPWAEEGADVSLPTLSHMRRRKVHRAISHGLRTETQTPISELPKFWKLLSDNLLHRHNVRPVHTLEEMTLLMHTFPERIRLATTWDGDELLAGVIVYGSSPLLAHAQYIASNATGRACGALDLLIVRAMRAAALEGYRWYDFGISTLHDGTGLNAGLLAQKEGFGARGICYDIYTLTL